jgi:hypothetical protein
MVSRIGDLSMGPTGPSRTASTAHSPWSKTFSTNEFKIGNTDVIQGLVFCVQIVETWVL